MDGRVLRPRPAIVTGASKSFERPSARSDSYFGGCAARIARDCNRPGFVQRCINYADRYVFIFSWLHLFPWQFYWGTALVWITIQGQPRKMVAVSAHGQ